MKKIKWGIIGCGDVTEVKSGPAFNKIKNSELTAVMRRNTKLAEDYAKRHKVPKWYNDADLLINDHDVNAIYIATPPSFHLEYVLAAAKAGKPVYVEKPMAMNFSECEKMIKACNDSKVKLFTAYYRRALPKFLKIKALIDEKTIGQILSFNVRFYKKPTEKDSEKDNWRVDPKIAGGGYFYDLGSHMIDLLLFFFGEIESAKGFFENQKKVYAAEDIVSASFKFKNGILGAGVWCFNTEEDLDFTEIIGTNGKIIYSTFENTDPVILIKNGKCKEFKFDPPEHIQQPLIQNIVDELLGEGKSSSTGNTGSITNWVFDKIFDRL